MTVKVNSINVLFSSSILTSTARSSLMTLLKKFRCSNITVSSFMRNSYSYLLRYSLLERLFVIYNVSNLDNKLVAVSSSITLYIISSARHNWIILAAFRSISPIPHLMYLQIMLTFPARFCEDHVAPTTLSPSFVINRSFL